MRSDREPHRSNLHERRDRENLPGRNDVVHLGHRIVDGYEVTDPDGRRDVRDAEVVARHVVNANGNSDHGT